MELKYVSQLKQLSSAQRQELQNLMDECGMFYGKELNEFVAPNEFKSAICMIGEQNEICGFAFIEDEESAIVLSYLYVAPAMRNKGIGSELVKCVKNFAKQRDAGRVELAVEKENNIARALYEKEGFQVQRTHDNKFIMTADSKKLEK